MREPVDLTQVVREASNGSSGAINDLFEACYPDLRLLAHRRLARERSDHSLQTTELIHESYLRLVDASKLDLRNRAHFFCVAASAMRRILTDYARRRNAAKRGGGARKVPLSDVYTLKTDAPDLDLLAFDQALTRLQSEKPQHASVIEMRFFGGMTYDEIAVCLEISATTVKRYSKYARARLYELMEGPT